MGAPTLSGPTSGTVQEGTGLVLSGTYTDSSGNSSADTFSIFQNASYGAVTINPSTGQLSYDLTDTNATVRALDPGQTLTDIFKVRVTDGGGHSDLTVTITIQGNFCFAAGTMIECDGGPRAVEDIGTGDLVLTRDHGMQPVVMALRHSHSAQDLAASPNLCGVEIGIGALGQDAGGPLPRRALCLSRQHRILVAPKGAGGREVLLPVHRLIGQDGVRIRPVAGGITYVNLLFDLHEVVIAEGAASESLWIGPQIAAEVAAGKVPQMSGLPLHLLRRHAGAPARAIPNTAEQKLIASKIAAASVFERLRAEEAEVKSAKARQIAREASAALRRLSAAATPKVGRQKVA